MSTKHSLPAAAVAAFFGLSAAAHAVPAVGLTGANQLFTFDTAAPGTATSTQAVSGLRAGETLLGLDYRPATSQLYGLGSTGRLYTIDGGVASFASTPDVAPSGREFGFGFNPVPDRLRVTGDTGQNLRVNVDTGATIVDGALAYAAGDVNAGKTPGVTAVGYTNQVSGTVTTTQLFDIDTANDVLALQNPPNAGTLNTVGALGVDASAVAGFDISGETGQAFAALTVAGITGLYGIDLATGAATRIGAFGVSGVTGIALVPAAVPEPASAVLLGAGVLGLLAARRRRA